MNYFIIFLVCVLTSSYGSLFGGGAMISLPVMMMLGIPPHIALSNNRIGALGVHIGFLIQVFKSKNIQYKYVLPLSVLAVFTSLLGSFTLISLPEDLIQTAISLLLILMFLFMIFKPEIGVRKTKASYKKRVLGWIFTSLVLLWQSTFGMIASVLYFVLCYFFGLTLFQASSTHKIPAIFSGVVATIVFYSYGLIDPILVLVIFSADLIGSYIGSNFFLHQNLKTTAYIFKTIILFNICFLLF